MLTKNDLSQIRKVAKIRKGVDVMLSMFDREYLELRRRIDRIEEYLKLPPLTQAS